MNIRLRTTLKLIEKQTPERHKTSGSERPLLPFDGDWLMTEGVSPQLDSRKSGGRCFSTNSIHR
ncbi:hypothetical protein JOC77_001395 [Peribacillus deserti]|uniref:Uncharacterized protein n=1 Tax=Peribacillus deserti TaxID=673318 RepID=A0ABS2QFQ8_9BACI|nr:hypothetical protein [Peribacillus deserti]MBM7691985.1 hypothetical protein [Peribacillus deserti]